jgi:Fe-S cluster assembly protein SufD
MTAVIENKLADRILNGIESKLPSLYGDGHARREAVTYFQEKGIPSKKWEDYKYINPEGLFRIGEFMSNAPVIREVTELDVERMTIIPGAMKLVIVNGVFIPKLSKLDRLPKGVTVKSIDDAVISDAVAKAHFGKQANATSDPFIAWNTAVNIGGVFVHIAANTQCEVPIHILHIAGNEAASTWHPRNLIVADRDSKAEVLESFETIGPVKTLTNVVTEVVAGMNAHLDHYRIQVEGHAGHQVNTTNVLTHKGSNYTTHTYSLSGAWVRNNLHIGFAEQHTETYLYGLYVLDQSRICDNHSVVDHSLPNCISNELYKGVMSGKSTAVFNGKIFVRRDAQKTNAYQTNRNILLSDDATINTKPQLEIYADDVKCSHGTSTGRLDEDALFYLRARGIGEAAARKLLVRAFVEEVVDKVPNEAVKVYIENRLDDLLS